MFVVREQYASEPLLPLRLFRNKTFTVTNVIAFIVGCVMFGGIIYLPLYLQLVKGASPTSSGLQLIPLMMGVITASVLSGRLITKIGRYKIFPIVGLGLITVGLWLLSHISATTSYGELSAYMVVLGVGVGSVMQVLVIAVQNAVPYSDLGTATASNTFFRSMGGSIGVAVFGAILTNGVSNYLVSHTSPGVARDKLLSALANGQVGSGGSGGAGASQQLKELFVGGYVHGIQQVFTWAVPIAIIGFALTWLLPEIRLATASGLGRGEMQAAREAAADSVER